MYKRNLNTALCLIYLCIISLQSKAYTIDGTATRVCFGDTTRLVNISNVPATAKVEWDLDNDGFVFETTGQTVRYVFPSADTLSIRLKITDSSGAEYYAALIRKVIVDPNPNTQFQFLGTCLGVPTQFANLSTIKDNSKILWQWDFTTDGSTDDTTTSPDHSYSIASNFNVTLKATTLFGCKASVSKAILIHQPPKADFNVNISCENYPTLFLNKSTFTADSLAQTIWSFEDDGISFLPDSVYHNFNSADTFSIKLSLLDNNGCFDSIIKKIIVLPTVSYQDSFSNGDKIYQGKTTDLFLTGNFTSLFWKDGGSQNPRTISDSGYYSFTLSNGLGCEITDSLYVGMKEFPAAQEKANDFMTPNGDGKNDVLYFPKLEAYKACDLKVYNMLGLEVFVSSSYQNNWDGTRDGKLANAGAYYYLLKCDTEKELIGNTNIIR